MAVEDIVDDLNIRGDTQALNWREVKNALTGMETFRIHINQTDTTDPATNVPFYAARTTNHTSGYGSTVGRTCDIIDSVQSDVHNFEYAANVGVIEAVQITTAQDLVGLHCYCVRNVEALGSVNGIWASNFEAIDDTGRKSSITPEYLRAIEINVEATGQDDLNLRIGTDSIFSQRTIPSGGDTQTSFYAAHRVIPASAINGSLAPIIIKNAYLADQTGTTGLGEIQIGFASNASMVDFLSQGVKPSIAAFYANHTLGSDWTAFQSPAFTVSGDGVITGAAASIQGRVWIGGATALTGFLNVEAGSTALAQINLAAGTAPTSPADGDMWYDGASIKFRIGGSTKTFTLT